MINIFLLLPYTILLRLYSLMHPTAYELTTTDTIASKSVFSFISDPLIQSIIAVVLIFIQAITINLLANNHRLHRTPSALSGMFYILLVSCIPEFQVLSPALIGITFVLIGILYVFKTYKMAKATACIFNAALCVSVATLFYPPYIFSALALFIGLTMMRNFKAKERLQFVVGFIVLVWIMASFLFYFDLLDWNVIHHFGFLSILDNLSWVDNKTLYTLGGVVFLILVALGNYYNFLKKKGIDIRKKLDFFYWLMLASFLSIFLFNGIDYHHYYFLGVSLSLFISMGVLLIKNKALAELLYLIVLFGVFSYQFGMF